MTKAKFLFCPGLLQKLPKKAQAILAHLQHFRALILILTSSFDSAKALPCPISYTVANCSLQRKMGVRLELYCPN